MAHRLQSHIVLGEPHLKKSINVSGSHVSVLCAKYGQMRTITKPLSIKREAGLRIIFMYRNIEVKMRKTKPKNCALRTKCEPNANLSQAL